MLVDGCRTTLSPVALGLREGLRGVRVARVAGRRRQQFLISKSDERDGSSGMVQSGCESMPREKIRTQDHGG